MMIIDVHGHVGQWFFSGGVGSTHDELAILERSGITLQLVSSFEAVTYHAATGNRMLLDDLEAGGGRLGGLVTIDPRELGEAKDDLDEAARSGWFLGVKIHADYTRSPVSSSRMSAAVGLAAEYGLPALVHTWGDDILDLARITADIPGARTIAGHMGATSWRQVPQARELCESIWFEPSWSTPHGGRIRWVVDAIGTDRLLFGSDSSLISPTVALASFEAAALDDSQLRQTMYGNATQLLDLHSRQLAPPLRAVVDRILAQGDD